MSVTETTGVSGYSNAGFSKSEADSDSWPEEDREKVFFLIFDLIIYKFKFI